MKVKQLPGDFIVKEIGSSALAGKGDYAIYQLTKHGIGAIEVINTISQKYTIQRTHISMGGMKDKYARTEQLISIYTGPKRDFEDKLFRLKYLGQSDQPIRPDSFTGNRFTICLRDLTKPEAENAQERLKEISQFGLPNYFDEQRFGSVRGGNEFPAKQLIKRDYEGALKTALTATSREDRSAVKKLREIILANWGDWEKCFSLLPRSSEPGIINYLKVQPTNFRQAFELIDAKLVLLYLHSYQSYLWNNGLSQLLINYADRNSIINVPYLLGEFKLYNKLPPDNLAYLKSLNIPFITHKTIFSNNELKEIFAQILREENIQLEYFRIRGMKKTYFRKGNRTAVILPQNLMVKEIASDELNKGKTKLTIEFELPRGSYATILIKRISYDF